MPCCTEAMETDQPQDADRSPVDATKAAAKDAASTLAAATGSAVEQAKDAARDVARDAAEHDHTVRTVRSSLDQRADERQQATVRREQQER